LSVEVGRNLKMAREARGLSLNEIAEKIRVDAQYLEAIEQGRFDLFTNQTYLRSYIRIYARYVGLNPQQLLKSAGLSYASEYTSSTLHTRSYRTMLHETHANQSSETKRYQVNAISSGENDKSTVSHSTQVNQLSQTYISRSRRNQGATGEKIEEQSLQQIPTRRSRKAKEGVAAAKKKGKKKKPSYLIMNGILVVSTVLWVIAAIGLVYLKITSS
jgi:transcriptional regulator with XRE-family HTH domain